MKVCSMCRVALENDDYTGYESDYVGPKLEQVLIRVKAHIGSTRFIATGETWSTDPVISMICHMCATRTSSLFGYRAAMSQEMEVLVWEQYADFMRVPGEMRHGQAIMNACAMHIPGFDYDTIPIDVWEKNNPNDAINYMNQVREVYS